MTTTKASRGGTRKRESSVLEVGRALLDQDEPAEVKLRRLSRDPSGRGAAGGLRTARRVRVVVKGILGMHGYAYLWVRDYGRLTAEQIADRFCDVVLDGMRLGHGGRPTDRSYSTR